MKTNPKFTVLRLLVLGVLVAGFNSKPASAQVFKGKFTLPSTTRWSIATLPAGDYSFTLENDYPGSTFTVLRGTQRVAQIPARGFSYTTSGRSEMVMENGNVRKVSLPQMGITFDYPENSPRHRAAPQKRQLAQIVPIAKAGAGR